MSLAIITGLFVFEFCIVMTILFGVQPSISNFHNVLPYRWKWIFTLFMCILGVLCMFIGKNNAMVLMGMFCILVGWFPRFYDDQELQHYLSALGIIGSGMWQVGIVLGVWYLPIIFIIAAFPVYYYKVRNYILWVELMAIVTILGGFIIDKSLK